MRHESPPDWFKQPKGHPKTLRDFLLIPYVLKSEAIEDATGRWLRQVAYPELAGCTAQALHIEDAIRELEKQRIQIIVKLLRAGCDPPCPRAPLEGSDGLWILKEVGLSSGIDHLLDKTAAELRDTADPFDSPGTF